MDFGLTGRVICEVSLDRLVYVHIYIYIPIGVFLEVSGITQVRRHGR